MWKNFVERGMPQMTIRRMRIARWISKATKPNSQYVIAFAFPPQQRLQERASISSLYVHCLSCTVYMTVVGPGLTLAQAELSSRKSVFNPRHVLMAFVVDKMTLGQIFIPSTSLFPFQHHCNCAPYSRIYHWRYITSPIGSIFQWHAL